MATSQSPKAVQIRHGARKSIGHQPSPDINTEKENMTLGNISTMSSMMDTKAERKKKRSKSIGPGGLDALMEDAGNRRKSVLPPIVKSILKPTISLSPPKQIPPHSSARSGSPAKTRRSISPKKTTGLDTQANGMVDDRGPPVTGAEVLPNPFGTPVETNLTTQSPPSELAQEMRVAVRTEEEQQAAAKERQKQEVLARRDARRKSLANRRVSFAPEATLHTWDVVELPEDSTTSSANSTRRASATSTTPHSPHPQRSPGPSSDASEPPSTPPEQTEETTVKASPAHQRDLHQKKRRRSSGIPPMNFNNPDDFSSSPSGGSSAADDDTDHQRFPAANDGSMSNSDDDDLVEDESTVTGIDVDGDDLTGQSVGSVHSTASSTGSSGRLEAALRQAANQAGTQGIEFDEHGDITMEMADDEITAAFKPWVKKGMYMPNVMGNLTALQDQENLNPFSPAFKANLMSQNAPDDDDQEQTMDFTRAAGAILPSSEKSQGSPVRGRRKSGATSRRQSSAGRRRSSGAASVLEDEIMELTTAIGGIQPGAQAPAATVDGFGSADEDEELTMEFTSVVGGLIDQKTERRGSLVNNQLANEQLLQEEHRRESDSSIMQEEDMDMTIAIGGILPSITEQTEPLEDDTMAMEITTAIGAILPKQLGTGTKAQAKDLMERETDAGQFSNAQLQEEASSISKLATPSEHVTAMASETGSPSLSTHNTRNSTRRSRGSRPSTTPKSPSKRETPLKKPSTPSKQLTPKPAHPTTPGKTPPSKNVSMRTGSPKKLFKSEIKHAASTPEASSRPSLFRQDTVSGLATPSVVLIPRERRFSGIGIDQVGLGSPRVAALLDRRGSIGEQAQVFTSQGRAVPSIRFENPRAMEQEVEREREEEERRESGRGILQREADAQGNEEEKDATVNLREMIESLTPKKKKLNGRKSLHIGAARGLLGKRPVELDEDEEDTDTPPKRLKGREGSPVKNIRLPGPPSKTETTGRITRATRLSLSETVGNVQPATPTIAPSPLKTGRITTPKDQSRFKDAELHSSSQKPLMSFDEKLAGEPEATIQPDEEDDRIHLQDFLNLTSIRFMELTTTKRRHTVAPNAVLDGSARKPTREGEDTNPGQDLERCVVAGACTVPMLELYQHSCRELKKYISEGRSIVREIEADTFEENPALFREYMSAAPEVRSIMDNQFKNVKTHARLLSKAMWYEWRMKLLDGLKEGLLGVGEGMTADAEILAEQEALVKPALPTLTAEHERLETQCQLLQAQADELASCDQEELKEAREKLVSTEEDIETKRKAVEELQRQLQEKEEGIANATERKQECLLEIKEAEKNSLKL
ncbi:Spc7 kinetochore protein domain [Lasallia pustulata]|uniref:Spc7 kinetochore protein domain n=1 Tax=Lasallia pustulata TaxID=136370 RepID=A0A1W5D2P7_9LECA|nr:Spc7 kinetochore protein domain [Lasallia pustulata]